ncbi:hypothetical protein [Endozoicomonas ascidiicola]|uniref:hypothetical protein n=1 Tax=Endozoicomonas ascidiicola TaxID=1698521 RepID=UPI000834C249|nr:hypothetical protein [Endozoicomonas ascidiicola]
MVSTVPLEDQLQAALVGQVNTGREELINHSHQTIDNALQEGLNQQDRAFDFAMEQIEKTRSDIGNLGGILGRIDTKHGEIAEKVEVGIRNAQQALRQEAEKPEEFSATFEGVGRTAPADYLIDGIEVQSKFINGANNNLRHVLDHMDKHANFSRDDSYHHIPKDTHEIILKVISGENVDGLSERSIRAIQEKVASIEALSGKPFEQIVQPGLSTYDEVQIIRVDETLDRHSDNITSENSVRKDNLESQADSDKRTVLEENQIDLGEMGKVALTGAAVGVAVSLTADIYKNYKAGKNIFAGDYDLDDWKRLGINTSKSAAIGGISSAAIYGLTNCAGMAAPFAGAVVTAVKGMSTLVAQYNAKEISMNELMDLGLILCSESAVVGICTAIGQTAIPVPILGAVIGSIAGKLVCFAVKKLMPSMKEKMANQLAAYNAQLDAAAKIVIDRINEEFDRLGDLTTAAFDITNNRNLLETSIELAYAYDVDRSKLIHNDAELNDFMLG